jgi:hypothetical protein
MGSLYSSRFYVTIRVTGLFAAVHAASSGKKRKRPS